MKSMGDNRNKGSYNKNKQDVNQPGNDTNRPEEAGEKILNRKIRTRWWVRILCVLASVVVFTTVYVLILPAVAVTEHDAENSGGKRRVSEVPAVLEGSPSSLARNSSRSGPSM